MLGNILFLADKLYGWNADRLKRELKEHAGIPATSFNNWHNEDQGLERML
jgi:hypothetical protein